MQRRESGRKAVTLKYHENPRFYRVLSRLSALVVERV